MKLCKDCKHLQVGIFGAAKFSLCRRDYNGDSLVTGRGGGYASTARSCRDLCGPDAKWFEPKRPSWWSRLWRRR